MREGAGTTVGTAVASSGTMTHYKISFAFAKLPDMSLTAFVRSVIQEMTDNPNFPTPCVPLPEISSALEKFTNDLVATHDGGRLSTAIKNASRQELIRLLRKQAPYVQSLTGTDLAQMLSSGFSAASTNRARMLLPKAEIRGIKSLQSTMLSIAVKPVQSARGYEARYKTENGEFFTAPFSTSSRSLLLQNLIPGVVYTIQARAVGGLRGCGEWSDPVARMAT